MNPAPLGLRIGSQTWPQRAIIRDQGLAAAAALLKDAGVEDIEMCSPFGYDDFAALTDGRAVKRILSDHGLTCVSSHFMMDELRHAQARSIAWAHDVGITQMIAATLGAGDSPTLDDVKRAAEEYNGIATRAASAGIQQGLHNEEFEMTSVAGQRTYDLLIERLDPDLVKFQFQMSTVTRGFVAADYFRQYPGRFFSIHLQDVDLAATRAGGPSARPVQVALGKGDIDWTATFEAAPIGGVKNVYIEQMLELTRDSVRFLRSVRP
jgi:sugar phosphate isomerase/epimerase